MRNLEKHIVKVLASIIFVAVNFQIFAQDVEAKFTTNGDTTSCTNFIVEFVNQSTGTDLNYQWDFGDSFFSTDENPSHFFEDTGSYTITLIVDDGNDYDTLIKENHIVIFNKPFADFTSLTDVLGCAPLTVGFKDISTPGDGAITGWSWNFGQGSVSDLQNPVFIYNNANVYSVILQVFDSNGCSDDTTKIDFVTVTVPPAAVFTADQTATCLESFDVKFSADASSGYGSLSYEWDFGDDESSTEIEPVHTYSGFNTSYDVRLIIVDEVNCTDTTLIEDFIEIGAILALFELENDTICPNINIPLTNLSTGASTFIWNFGDGSFVFDENPEYMYSDSGQYIIKLDVYAGSAECRDTYIDTVYVEYVIAEFISDTNYSCEVPFVVNYTNQSENAVSYEWHFGDGETSNDENAVHIFELTTELELNNYASYADTLTAISASGCRSKYTIPNNVEIILPLAKFIPNNDNCCLPDSLNGCAPLIVHFRDTSEFVSPYEDIASYSWNFGDVGTSSQSDTIFQFDDAGEYTVEFIITTDKGCKDTAFAEVKVGKTPVAVFEMEGDSTAVCASNPIQFNDLSYVDNAEVNGWQWYFSDDLTSTEQNPQHAFTDIGFVNVTLIATYNACQSAKYTVDSIAEILGPAATFTEEVNCENSTEFTFNGNIQGEDKFYWNFGDDSPLDSITQTNLIHIYDTTGDFNVFLEAFNYTTGCSYLSEKTIAVRDVKALFIQDIDFGCEGYKVTFDAFNSSDFFTYDIQGLTGSFLWNFGDGSPVLFTEDTIVEHIYKKRGKSSISLVLKDENGCSDTLQSFYNNYEPIAAFTQDTAFGCAPLTVNFTDTSLSDITILIRKWYFGDSSPFGNLLNEEHTFRDIDTYSVYLEIQNVVGCNDTITKEALITATRPRPGFSLSDNTICVGDTMFTSNFTSQDSYESILWNFYEGDDSTSVLHEPFHIFADSGYYNISMHLIDEFGCDSTLLKQNHVHVHSIPVVDFSASLTDTSCYPAQIWFTDLTTHPYEESWNWSFGENQGSADLENPSKTYTQTGNFSISLEVGTTYGCIDDTTKTNYINISGPTAQINAPDSACPKYPVEFSLIDPVSVVNTNWDFYDGTTYPGDTIEYSFDEYGKFYNYRVIIADGGGGNSCIIAISDSIYIYAFSPGFELVSDGGCIPFILEITDTSTGVTEYLWEFGDGNLSSDAEPEYTYYEVDTFLLQQIVLNEFACIDTAEIEIVVYALPAVDILNNDTLICFNDEIQISVTGGSTYLWSPNYEINDISFANPLISPKLDTEYHVLGTDNNGCKNTDSIFVEVQPIPVIDSITADTAIVIGETDTLHAHFINGMTYFWSPDINISSTDSLNPVVLIEDDMVYTFTVIDSNNCFVITHDVNIDVIREYEFDAPTAFTPNGDDINDVIYIDGQGITELIEFKVYNRMGQLVFFSTDINEGWDGTYQGKGQPVGTYVYTAIVESYDGRQRARKGSFRLLR